MFLRSTSIHFLVGHLCWLNTEQLILRQRKVMKMIKGDVKTVLRGEDVEKKGNDFSLERRKRNMGKVAKVIKEVDDLNDKTTT